MIRRTFQLFFILSILSFSQPLDSVSNPIVAKTFIVDSIFITGNHITEPYIILEELSFSEGDEINETVLNYNRERIYSLGIFTRVDVARLKKEDKNNVQINVEESWYIWPIPFVGLKDHDWNKISFGLDVSVKNFRGRNENLGFKLAFGYDPEFRISYSIPYLLRAEQLYLNLSLYYGKMFNKSDKARTIFGDDFEQKYASGFVTLGKRFNIYNKGDIYLGFQYVETPFFMKGISVSDNRIDRILFAGLNYVYDSRDLAQFPINGILTSFDFASKGLGMNDINYNIFSFDYRHYKSIYYDLSAKWRFAVRHTFGKNVPYFENSFLGISDRVRGHFTNRREGNSLFFTSVEVKYPFIKELNISFDLPIIPKELLTYRCALYMQIFADAGTVKFREDPMSLNNFQRGFGFGFTVLVLPYNIARFELGFNENMVSEFILDLGISF